MAGYNFGLLGCKMHPPQTSVAAMMTSITLRWGFIHLYLEYTHIESTGALHQEPMMPMCGIFPPLCT